MPLAGNRQPSLFLVVSKELKRVFFSLLFLFAFFTEEYHLKTWRSNGDQVIGFAWVIENMVQRAYVKNGLWSAAWRWAFLEGFKPGGKHGIQTWRMVRMVGMMDFFFHIECV